MNMMSECEAPTDPIRDRLLRLIKEGESLTFAVRKYTSVDLQKFYEWQPKSIAAIASIAGRDHPAYEKYCELVDGTNEYKVRYGIGILKGVLAEYDNNNLDSPILQPAQDCLSHVELICNAFHLVARQLRSRHNTRPTIEINDEYDVQDLMHALLRLYFDDIREEEWTPSYAGSSSRVDFLLKSERTVIEIKMTRNGLLDKHIGEQLIIDIEKYKAHPDCDRLICFVYDRADLLKNPRGLEADLSNPGAEMPVHVFIRP